MQRDMLFNKMDDVIAFLIGALHEGRDVAIESYIVAKYRIG